MVQAGPEEMLTQFFDSCIRQTKMSMEEKDWEGAVLNIKRYVEFRDTIAESLTDEERAVMQAEQVSHPQLILILILISSSSHRCHRSSRWPR